MAHALLTEAVKARISGELKDLLQTEADSRHLDASDVVREALREYFAKREARRPKKNGEPRR